MTATLERLSDYENKRGKPMPDLNHALIQSNILFYLRLKFQQKFTVLSEIHLDMPIRDRVPDLAIYRPIRFNPNENEIKMTIPPLAAIEILSEMQSPQVLLKKRNEYFLKGVKSYWLVLPSLRTIYVFESMDEYQIFSHRDILVDKLLGIELDLKEIFKQ